MNPPNLIHRLQPFGYGKEVLRARHKIYLADTAIALSVLLKGKALWRTAELLESLPRRAVFNHLYSRYYQQSVGFSYWQRPAKEAEVDIIASIEDRTVPFEVKYRSQATGPDDLRGIRQFCLERDVNRGYVITKDLFDFKLLPLVADGSNLTFAKIPAPLACYWLGSPELEKAVPNALLTPVAAVSFRTVSGDRQQRAGEEYRNQAAWQNSLQADSPLRA